MVTCTLEMLSTTLPQEKYMFIIRMDHLKKRLNQVLIRRSLFLNDGKTNIEGSV